MHRAGARWAHIVGLAAAAFVLAVSVALAGSAQTASSAGGASVLSGVYTDEQAKRGEAVSDKLCVTCHGPELSGGEAGPSLVGDEFVAVWATQTVADFHIRTHETMPADAPKTLTPEQTTDVTAYVLKLNKFPAGSSELPTDVAALKQIRIEGR